MRCSRSESTLPYIAPLIPHSTFLLQWLQLLRRTEREAKIAAKSVLLQRLRAVMCSSSLNIGSGQIGFPSSPRSTHRCLKRKVSQRKHSPVFKGFTIRKGHTARISTASPSPVFHPVTWRRTVCSKRDNRCFPSHALLDETVHILSAWRAFTLEED